MSQLSPEQRRNIAARREELQEQLDRIQTELHEMDALERQHSDTFGPPKGENEDVRTIGPAQAQALISSVPTGEWFCTEQSVWTLNAKGTNRVYVLVQPGKTDTGERTSEAELNAVARLIAAALALGQNLVSTYEHLATTSASLEQADAKLHRVTTAAQRWRQQANNLDEDRFDEGLRYAADELEVCLQEG